MKVQLSGQHVRFRIDEAELAQLTSGHQVENRTDLPNASCFVQRVALTRASVVDLRIDAGVLALELPADVLAAHVARLPCRDGLQWRFDLHNGASVEVSFDIDVRDSTRTRMPKRDKR